MADLFIEEYTQIYTYPEPLSHPRGEHITLGDLHGNTILLLYMLVREGVVETSVLDYYTLVEIYFTPYPLLTEEAVHQFEDIVSRLRIKHRPTLHFIGDELADRGSNDYFTLLVFEKLHQERVPFNILLSNHGMEFIQAYEVYYKTGLFIGPRILPDTMAISFLRMGGLLEEKRWISYPRLCELIETVYKPHLVVFDYLVDPAQNHITILTHAPVGLETIRSLAEKCIVLYDDSTLSNFIETLDNIRRIFAAYTLTNTIHLLCDEERMLQGYCNTSSRLALTPLEDLIWNREYGALERPHQVNDFFLSFGHGHDLVEISHGNIYNLDGELGKGSTQGAGMYKVLVSNRSAPVPQVEEVSDETTEVTQTPPEPTSTQPAAPAVRNRSCSVMSMFASTVFYAPLQIPPLFDDSVSRAATSEKNVKNNRSCY